MRAPPDTAALRRPAPPRARASPRPRPAASSARSRLPRHAPALRRREQRRGVFGDHFERGQGAGGDHVEPPEPVRPGLGARVHHLDVRDAARRPTGSTNAHFRPALSSTVTAPLGTGDRQRQPGQSRPCTQIGDFEASRTGRARARRASRPGDRRWPPAVPDRRRGDRILAQQLEQPRELARIGVKRRSDRRARRVPFRLRRWRVGLLAQPCPLAGDLRVRSARASSASRSAACASSAATEPPSSTGRMSATSAVPRAIHW